MNSSDTIDDLADRAGELEWPQFTDLLKFLRLDSKQYLEVATSAERSKKFVKQATAFQVNREEIEKAFELLRPSKQVGQEPRQSAGTAPSESSSVKKILDEFSGMIISIHSKIASLAASGVASQSETVKQ